MSGLHVSGPIQVGVVRDEPIRLMGFTCIFEQDSGESAHDLVPVVGTLSELLANRSLGYVLLDLNSSSKDITTLAAIRKARPGMRTIVIGPEGDEELVFRAIMSGARAYLDSSAEPATVRKAIEMAARGSIWAPRPLLSKLIDRMLADLQKHTSNGNPRLTARECQVLDLILTANSNREIAAQLGIDEKTVKSHVGRLMHKTGADNRVELSLCALRRSGLSAADPVQRRIANRRLPAERGEDGSQSLLTT